MAGPQRFRVYMIRKVNTLYVIIGWRANECGFAINVPASGAGDRKSGPACLKFLWRGKRRKRKARDRLPDYLVAVLRPAARRTAWCVARPSCAVSAGSCRGVRICQASVEIRTCRSLIIVSCEGNGTRSPKLSISVAHGLHLAPEALNRGIRSPIVNCHHRDDNS